MFAADEQYPKQKGISRTAADFIRHLKGRTWSPIGLPKSLVHRLFKSELWRLESTKNSDNKYLFICLFHLLWWISIPWRKQDKIDLLRPPVFDFCGVIFQVKVGEFVIQPDIFQVFGTIQVLFLRVPSSFRHFRVYVSTEFVNVIAEFRCCEQPLNDETSFSVDVSQDPWRHQSHFGPVWEFSKENCVSSENRHFCLFFGKIYKFPTFSTKTATFCARPSVFRSNHQEQSQTHQIVCNFAICFTFSSANSSVWFTKTTRNWIFLPQIRQSYQVCFRLGSSNKRID